MVRIAGEHGTAERLRLAAQRAGTQDWRLWGPYLAERAWGTVREDYSAGGQAWEDFSHDQARSRAYRWNEDGLGGISDANQFLCFALALWNGRDPILKERAFGLTGSEGNRGEDVKEYYFLLDATPSHSWLRYLYKYPQAEFPYAALAAENRRRTRYDPAFGLLDTGVFESGRYWDVAFTYAKVSPTEIHIRIEAFNRGPDATTLHILPTLWFRNTWSWQDGSPRPLLREIPSSVAWAFAAIHPELGEYRLYGAQPARTLFTENESNAARLWGQPNPASFVKDAFHDAVIACRPGSTNPARQGTKAAAWYVLETAPHGSVRIDLVLAAASLEAPFARSEVVFALRKSEADAFYDRLLPDDGADEEDRLILRQSLAGMIWSKQFFHYDVERWLDGDLLPPPETRRFGRNRCWKHLKAADIISMPDTWEYPWFAAWDLAYHCCAFALLDIDFAKDQIEILVSERYLHPNGQIPAYEWSFGDVNPPVHAMAALEVFRAERAQRGEGDPHFLHRVFHKLLLNYGWWINRKDAEGSNIFEGGFLGLDNISVFDRSQPLPPGYSLKQADATGWMAAFALNMTVMALELALDDADYEAIAIQIYQQFLSIANAIAGRVLGSVSLWDPHDGFFKDLIVCPDGQVQRIDVYSMVGLIPLFASEVIEHRLLERVPRFSAMLRAHKGGKFQGSYVCACPDWENERGEHLLSLVDHTMLPQIMQRLLDKDEFLSPYGVRSVSRCHLIRRELGKLPHFGQALIEYVPGESTSDLFGGNSNWRGPIWLPVNYTLIQSIEKFHRFLGDGFTVRVPCAGDRRLTLHEIADLLTDRLVSLYRPDQQGVRPALRGQPPFEKDPHWRDLLLFYEYFHAETGQGLGAAHQTGWTGLLANLVLRRHAKDRAAQAKRHIPVDPEPS